MNRTFRRLAVVAAFLIATLSTFAWWSARHSSVAFADVIRVIDTIHSVCFTATIQGGTAQPVVMKMSVLDDRVRQEMGHGVANIIDAEHEQILSLMTGERRAFLLQIPGLADAGQENRNLLLMLRECLHRANGNVEDLGSRQISGRQARGFRANDDGRLVTLWVDPDTALPLEVELPWGDGQTTILITDYEFNPTLDDSLFAMTPPPGYALVQGSMNLKDTTEQDLADMLGLLADANEGDFPATLALGSLQYDIGKAEGKISPWQQFQLGGTLARAVTFLQTCHDPKYLGAGVTKGESNRPVYRYRPKGSQVYRVIYGDLSIRDVAADQMPTVEQTAAAATRSSPLADQNRSALDKLRTTLQTEYPHLLTGLDFDALLAPARQQLEAAKTARQFGRALLPVLGQLHNPRLTIGAKNEWMHFLEKQNVSWNLLPKLVPDWHANGGVRAGRFPDGIGYLTMQWWGDEQRDPNRRAVITELGKLADARALILDLRGNGDGGSLDYITPLAGCFLDQPVVYAQSVPRATSVLAEAPAPLRLQPNAVASHFGGRVIVLIGPSIHGCTELVPLMLKHAPGCVVIGEKTSGMLGKDQQLDLGNGVTVALPQYTISLPDGTDVSAGVLPDMEVKATQADFAAGRDPVLDAALNLLRQ